MFRWNQLGAAPVLLREPFRSPETLLTAARAIAQISEIEFVAEIVYAVIWGDGDANLVSWASRGTHARTCDSQKEGIRLGLRSDLLVYSTIGRSEMIYIPPSLFPVGA